MLIKVVTLPFQATLGGFNDNEFRDFIKDKDVVSINDHLFVRNEIPYLVLVVKYLHKRPGESQPMTHAPHASPATPKPEHDGWKGLLTEADMGMFNMLREWRNKRSQRDGVPPYVLFTNRQLAEIVKLRPVSASEISKIEGVAQAKVEKYGSDVAAFFVGQEPSLPTGGQK